MRHAALLFLALMVAGCTAPRSSRTETPPPESVDGPSPAASEPAPRATMSPTPATVPSPSATATVVTLAPDSIGEVVVSDLVVRSAPGVDPGTSAILDGRLRTGDRMIILRGPTPASGYDWYLVAPLTRPDGSMGPFGWVAAASREGDTWVEASPPACPATPDLASVLSLHPYERLACFRNDSMTLEASFGGCGAGGGPWVWEPSWLMVIGGCSLALDADGEPSLLVRVPPGGTAFSDGSLPAAVRGHFDDPAAAACSVTTTDSTVPPPAPAEAVLMCRSQFVAEG